MFDLIGGILLMVRRSLRQHALSTVVTVVSVALAAGLLMTVFSIQKQTMDAFTRASTGFDAILGARGSQLQLVLNTVFHLETSPGNIPYSSYLSIKADPRVKAAVPYAVGDNYRGYRIVGTTLDFFSEYRFGKDRTLDFIDGNISKEQLAPAAARGKGIDGSNFNLKPGVADAAGHRVFDPARQEAVIGSLVARQTGLRHGDVFNSYHGLDFVETEKHATEFIVVGVLEPTNSPVDRVIWIPLEGYYRMAGHEPYDKKTGQKIAIDPNAVIPDELKEVSAVMLKLRSPAHGAMMDVDFNRMGTTRTIAWPVGKVIADLFIRLGWANQVLQYVAYLVAVVAAAAILASIYNTMNERRREFAIMRALGARRATVFSAIVAESATIAALGSALGFAVYFALMATAAYAMRMKAGVVLDVTAFHDAWWFTPIGMIALGAMTGTVPAWKAYATDVATNLVPAS